MLRTENISFSVGKKQILKNVSASFLPGEFNMILGPNGSGKSSFLKIFSGEINKFQGNVLYEDKKIKELRKEELAKKRAVMSQQADLGFPLLVEEVVTEELIETPQRCVAPATNVVPSLCKPIIFPFTLLPVAAAPDIRIPCPAPLIPEIISVIYV